MNTQDKPVYLLYLAEADRNSATFAVFSKAIRQDDEFHEIRIPDRVSLNSVNSVIEKFGRPIRIIDNQLKFREWLERHGNWAVVTQEAAEQIVPHWLSTSAQYRCEEQELIGTDNQIRYRLWCDIDSLNQLSDKQDLATFNWFDNPEDDAGPYFLSLQGDFVITKQPIHVQ